MFAFSITRLHKAIFFPKLYWKVLESLEIFSKQHCKKKNSLFVEWKFAQVMLGIKPVKTFIVF